MAENAFETMKSRLSTEATGWGAVVDGVLDVRTICDSQRNAALRALVTKGILAASTCTDDTCNCVAEMAQKRFPTIKLVRVVVAVAQ